MQHRLSQAALVALITLSPTFTAAAEPGALSGADLASVGERIRQTGEKLRADLREARARLDAQKAREAEARKREQEEQRAHAEAQQREAEAARDAKAAGPSNWPCARSNSMPRGSSVNAKLPSRPRPNARNRLPAPVPPPRWPTSGIPVTSVHLMKTTLRLQQSIPAARTRCASVRPAPSKTPVARRVRGHSRTTHADRHMACPSAPGLTGTRRATRGQ
jgi:hypothetical protein